MHESDSVNQGVQRTPLQDGHMRFLKTAIFGAVFGGGHWPEYNKVLEVGVVRGCSDSFAHMLWA